MTGSRRWPATAWRELLELALPALDEAGTRCRWTLGGGTALSLRLNHRISYDIDLFFEDAACLAALSPNRNRAARAISDRWQEPGHYLKIERDEGAIDFIVAARQSDAPSWSLEFEGRKVPVEDPVEILAKKLRYRGSRLAARDLFDIAAVHRADPSALQRAAAAVPDAVRRAVDRIERMADRYRETIRGEVNPTQSGAELLDVDPLDVARMLVDRATIS